MWRRAGVYGRLTGGMVLAWPAADVLRALGVLPRYHVVSMLFGAVVSGMFACAIAMMRGRGRRRWQHGHAVVLNGGWQDCASANAAAIAAGAARLEEVERRLEALQEGLCRAFAAAGQPPPAAAQVPAQPALRVIRGGKSA